MGWISACACSDQVTLTTALIREIRQAPTSKNPDLGHPRFRLRTSATSGTFGII